MTGASTFVSDASGAPVSLPPAVRKLVEERREKTVALVERHTGYDRDTILEKLYANGGNYQAIIAEFMGVGERKAAPAEPRSLTQRKYAEIRKLMNEASMNYYRKKDAEEAAQAAREGGAGAPAIPAGNAVVSAEVSDS